MWQHLNMGPDRMDSGNDRENADFPADLSGIPVALAEIVQLFENLPESERRETLMGYALRAASYEPHEGEAFDYGEERRDEVCTDKVGVYVRVEGDGKLRIRMRLGSEVQTLTRAMAAILCRGLEGTVPHEVIEVPDSVISRIVGARLMRLRSRTAYYLLDRIRESVRQALGRAQSVGGE